MGVGSVTATFVGQNIGARNIPRARQSVRSAMILTVVIAIIGCLAILPIQGTDYQNLLEDTPESLELSVEYMFFILTGLPLTGIFQVSWELIRGAGNDVQPDSCFRRGSG